MSLFSYKKLLSFFTIFFVLLSSTFVTEQLLAKSEIIRKSKICFKNFQHQGCNNLFLEIEKIQLIESEQDRYKCQASILGLQTELIEAYYFKKLNKKTIMIPYVIKNC